MKPCPYEPHKFPAIEVPSLVLLQYSMMEALSIVVTVEGMKPPLIPKLYQHTAIYLHNTTTCCTFCMALLPPSDLGLTP